MLKNAESVLTFKTGIVPRWKYTLFEGRLREEFKYTTNFLLDDKLKMKDADTLAYINIFWIKKNNDIKRSAKFLCRAWLGGPTVAGRQHRARDLKGKIL